MANGHVRPGQSVTWRNETGAPVRSGALVPFGGGIAAKALQDIPAGQEGVVTLFQVHRFKLPPGVSFRPGELVFVASGEISTSGDVLGRFIRLDEGGWAEVLIMPLAVDERGAALAARVSTLEGAGYQTAQNVDDKIATALQTFDKLDYKVADSAPTPTTVVIDGKTEQTRPGVRYMVKHTTDDRYEEYILINGAIYDIGDTGDLDLSGYATTAAVDTALAEKQATLVSGENIRTLHGRPLLGSGDLELFVVKKNGADIEVNAGERKLAQLQVVAANEDYQIVAFKRVFISNSSPGGSNRDYIALQSISTGGGSKQAQIALLNTGSAAAKIKVDVECLCMLGAA